MSDAHRRNDHPVARWIVPGGMLLMVVAASRAGFSSTRPASPLAGVGTVIDGIVVGVSGAALAAMAALIALVVRRPRRHLDETVIQTPPWVHSTWSRLVAVLIGLALVTAPIAGLLLIHHLPADHGGRSATTVTSPHPTPRLSSKPGRTGAGHIDHLLLIVMIVAAIALAVAAWQATRHHHSSPRSGHPPTPVPEISEGLIDEATTRARRAIAAEGSPRAAVIASYVAMSRAIRDAAGRPVSNLTPRRMLAHAAEAGLVDRRNAEIVTDLFERARYSTITITEADRQLAAEALGHLQGSRQATGSTP